MSLRFALDFGTSNTLVARSSDGAGEPETLRLPGLSEAGLDGAPPLVPTILHVADASVPRLLAGAEVRARGLDVAGDHRYFSGFKRGIVAEVPGFVPRLDGVEVSPPLAGRFFLERVFAALPPPASQEEELVVTVPVAAFESYVAWLVPLVERGSGRQIRVLDESTAAALGYAVPDLDAPILVIDFGGGTLDVSLVRLPPGGSAGVRLGRGQAEPGSAGVATVVAKAGLVFGGEDLDHWLVDDFLTHHGTHAGALAEDVPLLKGLAERVKIQLSSSLEADFVFFHADSGRTWRHHYTRDAFEDLLERKDLFARIQGTFDHVLRQAEAQGVFRADIGRVLLVGGTTLIPAVARTLRQGFPRDRVLSHKPFEAVAHGALALAGGGRLADHLFHGYGVRYWDPHTQRHLYEPLFFPGQPYPTGAPVELVLRASRPGQPAIELIVGEMEPGGTSASEVVFDAGRLVANPVMRSEARVVPLNDGPEARTIARLEPPGEPGVDRIRAQFRVDRERRLRLTVEDLKTGETLIADGFVARLR